MQFDKVVIGGGVNSVNGMKGDVWIDAATIGTYNEIQIDNLIKESKTAVILDWLTSSYADLEKDMHNRDKLIALRDTEELNNTEIYLRVNDNTYYKCVKYVKQSTMIELTFEGEGKRYEVALYGDMSQCSYISGDVNATTFSIYDNNKAATMKATATYIQEQIEANLYIDSGVKV